MCVSSPNILSAELALANDLVDICRHVTPIVIHSHIVIHPSGPKCPANSELWWAPGIRVRIETGVSFWISPSISATLTRIQFRSTLNSDPFFPKSFVICRKYISWACDPRNYAIAGAVSWPVFESFVTSTYFSTLLHSKHIEYSSPFLHSIVKIGNLSFICVAFVHVVSIRES